MPFEGYGWRTRLVHGDGLEPPEPETAGVTCCRCGDELPRGKLYGVWEDRVVCEDCVDAEWEALSPQEKLEFLGFDVRRG